MKSKILIIGLIAFMVFAGCTNESGENRIVPENKESQLKTNNATGSGAIDNAGAIVGKGEGGTEADIPLNEWKAPDDSITLQIPAGWIAAEKQVDTCTVNWSVQDSTATKSAYMNNQIMVLKSEEAREMYKIYGMQGIDSTPVSGYLLPEQAVSQIVAPLAGSSDVAIVETDNAMTALFSQAACISGLAACNALVFDSTYNFNGIAMKGKYFVQTIDLGEGTTWWINIWGYTSPSNEWNESKELLEKIFTSVKYTESWKSKCMKNAEETAGIINEVIDSRRESSENSAEQWDEYART